MSHFLKFTQGVITVENKSNNIKVMWRTNYEIKTRPMSCAIFKDEVKASNKYSKAIIEARNAYKHNHEFWSTFYYYNIKLYTYYFIHFT